MHPQAPRKLPAAFACGQRDRSVDSSDPFPLDPHSISAGLCCSVKVPVLAQPAVGGQLVVALPRARRAANHHILIRSVDKTHHSKKYDIKAFMEAEFKRRNLFKKTGAE
jgi:hypothetical protein